jgi:diguanylate cyclase (GGDEF)-like protein/PAS domain S-box-containing protein
MALPVSLLFILAVASLAYYSHAFFSREWKENISRQQFSLVSSLADNIDDKLRIAQKSLLASAAQLPLDAVSDPDKAQRFLDNRYALKSLFDNALFLFSSDGRIIAESPYREGRRGRDISFREYFKTTMATGKPHISSPYISTHNPGHPAIMLTAPVFDRQGKIVALFSGAFDLQGENFLGELTHVKIGSTGYLFLYDSQRTMIVHPDRNRIMKQDVPVGKNFLFDQALKGFEGSGETTNSRGIQMLASFKRLRMTDWVLAANFPVEEAYAPLRKAGYYFIAVLLAGTLVVLGVVFFVMQRLTAPLHRFISHVETLPDKSWPDKMIEMHTGDEIEKLATAFNDMVKTLDIQQAALRESELNFRAMADNANDGLQIILDRQTFVYSNQRVAEITGYSVAQLASMKVSDLIFHDEMTKIASRYEALDAGINVPRQFETIIVRKDGCSVPIEVTSARTLWHGKDAELVVIRDISERKQGERSLKISEERYRMLVENQSDLVVKTDPADRILFVSPSFCDLFGQTEQELIGRHFLPIIQSDNLEETFKCRQQLYRAPHRCYFEQCANTRYGKRWFGWSEKAVLDDQSNVVAVVGMGRDITDRKGAEFEFHQLAYYDILTSLPNRSLLNDRLSQALAQAGRDGRFVAVLFLDLDRFKSVNDTLGHAAGDQLLMIIAGRLLDCMRESDTVARLGGDEFVVVLNAIEHEDDIVTVAEKILSVLSEPVQLEKQEIFPTASIGISLFPNDGNDVNGLLKNADMAMYQAKDQGRNNYQFYSQEMNVKALEHLMLETSLRRALERDEFFLVYQPQMNLQSGQLVGVEVLLRWNHPDLGVLMPSRFISMAEETGLILSIGEWVLRTACRQNRIWLDEGLGPLRIAVNLSGRQFKQKGLIATVAEVLEESGLPPDALELELTESIIMEKAEETISILLKLKEMGINLAVDDFGTGYSSLSYLKHFPIDRVKIDRSFVRDISTNSDDAAIVEAIIFMAHSLNLQVTAEGVEEHVQLMYLAERKCDEIQGYLLSQSLPVDEFTRFLRGGSMIQG